MGREGNKVFSGYKVTVIKDKYILEICCPTECLELTLHSRTVKGVGLMLNILIQQRIKKEKGY